MSYYDDWEPRWHDGRPAPDTVEEKIEYGVTYFSGDSGVSEENLQAYLEDLAETAKSEGARDALEEEGWGEEA